jgi:hypothetical protein
MQGIGPSQERRRSRRLKIGQALKVRPSDPDAEAFEDSATTNNVSRDGIYFLTMRKVYREGMRVFVILPYHGPGDQRNHEYVGQVTRVDASGENRWGVAVQLLSESR